MKTKYCKIIIVLLVIIGTFFFYHFRHPVYYKTEDQTIMNNVRPIKDLKRLILSKGDTLAYKELKMAYLDVKYFQEYLLYSIIMADKYKYHHAYYDVYYSLTSVFLINHYAGAIDKKTLDLALKYLKEGVELNDRASVEEFGELCLDGQYVSKDTVLGKKLLEKAKSCW